MVKRIVTMREAADEWVRGFNAFPLSMITRIFADECWREVTEPCVGSRVHVDLFCGTVIDIDKNNSLYAVELDGGEEISCEKSDIEPDYYDSFPMWGTVWQFSDPCDKWWLEDEDGITTMSSCGFRVYKHDEYGYFFGIDGCGYDFYEQHWIPLYKKRGLKWHEKE